jgi:hypothetical protein
VNRGSNRLTAASAIDAAILRQVGILGLETLVRHAVAALII